MCRALSKMGWGLQSIRKVVHDGRHSDNIPRFGIIDLHNCPELIRSNNHRTILPTLVVGNSHRNQTHCRRVHCGQDGHEAQSAPHEAHIKPVDHLSTPPPAKESVHTIPLTICPLLRGMDGPPAPPPAKESVGQVEDRIAIELALAESAEPERLQPQPQPSPQLAQFSGQPDEWRQDKSGKWRQKAADGTWWRYEEETWYCTTAEVAGILAATQGDAAPVAAQLQPQPQPQYGQTRGDEASSEVDLEADKSLVGGDAEDSDICQYDSVNTDDSSSDASLDNQGLANSD